MADVRLIDALALLRRIVAEENEIITDNAHAIGLHNGLTLAQAMVTNAPTIDAVPVVQCKDCKMFVENKEAVVTYCRRGLLDRSVRQDDFCSHGERKDDEV